MIANFRYVELAETELVEAAAHYATEANVGLAFVDEIERVLGLAMQFPASGTLVAQRRVRRELRLYRLNPDFPYDIVATVMDEQDLFMVLAVAHHKRRPNYWISRITQSR